jgi:hypothetical protein
MPWWMGFTQDGYIIAIIIGLLILIIYKLVKGNL